MAQKGLLIALTGREIRSRFIGSASGWLWLLVTPLLLLAVYGFVFGFIFQARVPQGLDMPFVAWLAVALWPWLAFSDAVLKGAQGILQHAALISKVAVPRHLLVVSSLTASFVLQLVGFLVVLLAIQLMGTAIQWYAVPYLLVLLATLYLFALGLGLMLSAVQVFVRDLEQVLPTFLMFWFFLTPILYSPEMLPGDVGRWLQLNPMTWWMEEIRNALFLGQWLPGPVFLALLLGAALSYVLGRALFERMSPHFEDFL